MRKIKYLLLALTFTCLLNACNTLSSDNQKLYDKVIFEHDEVMPKMSDMSQLEIKISQQLKATALDSLDRANLIQRKLALKKAGDDMMQWMNEFHGMEMEEAFYQNLSQEEIKTYLETEKEKIIQVGKDMLESIDKAEEALK